MERGNSFLSTNCVHTSNLHCFRQASDTMSSLHTMHLDLGITQLRKCTGEKIKALETLLQEILMMEI